MVRRNIGTNTSNLSYDAENRMVQVSGAVTETFKYNGDGQRIIATQGVTTTVYIGNYFEWHGTTADMVKYYYSGANRVAMRVGANPPVYLMGDHLGSTSVAVNEQGEHVGNSPQLYKAWGETRAGEVPTRYQYTGQFNQNELGIYYYNARWYDPYITQFSQPDPIIPDPYNPLDWNRYQYTRSNPLKFIDPTGYSQECAIGEYGCSAGKLSPIGKIKLYKEYRHITFKEKLEELTEEQIDAYLDLAHELGLPNKQTPNDDSCDQGELISGLALAFLTEGIEGGIIIYNVYTKKPLTKIFQQMETASTPLGIANAIAAGLVYDSNCVSGFNEGDLGLIQKIKDILTEIRKWF